MGLRFAGPLIIPKPAQYNLKRHGVVLGWVLLRSKSGKTREGSQIRGIAERCFKSVAANSSHDINLSSQNMSPVFLFPPANPHHHRPSALSLFLSPAQLHPSPATASQPKQRTTPPSPSAPNHWSGPGDRGLDFNFEP
ncbi:hypothetical protein ACE6H2_028493 [Prunus campanulata]